MNISTNKPPNWEQLEKKFNVKWDDGVIVTYGDTAYCKSGGMSPDLRIHEQTHMIQQATMGVEIWWERYFADKKFRLDQELEAYRNQTQYIKRFVSNRKKRANMMEHIWESMARMYDGMVSYETAKELLPL